MTCLLAVLPFLSQGRVLAQDSMSAVHITYHDNNIYNNGQVIGGFKIIVMDDLMSVVIYGKGHNRIAEATHDPDETYWRVATPVDQKNMQTPWNQKDGMILLFKFLVEQKYL